MRFLLAGILVILPSIAQAQSLDCANLDQVEPCLKADSTDAELHGDPHSPIELGPYPNPYSPTSPTNFEAFLEPYLFVQGREGIILYAPRFPSRFDVSDQERDGSFNHQHVNSRLSMEHFTLTPAASVR
jgi:hypothetical protein